MFHRLSKHLEFRQKYSTARCIFNSLLGVWISRWNTVSQTRFTLEEIVPDSWWIRNVLVPDWFCRLHTRGRIRNENIPVWSCLRRFWIWNLKWNSESENFWIRKFCRVKAFLSNPDILLPAIFWVCGRTKMADLAIQRNPKSLSYWWPLMAVAGCLLVLSQVQVVF